ncbi:cupin domain-containing protein [bacterium]|nr:cupin domain-containing protein [bacterium]
MSTNNIRNIPKEVLSVGQGTSKQVLISSEEGPNFAMRRFIIEAEGYMTLHSNSVEHEQYCLAGAAEVTIGNETMVVNKNDIVFIPAGTPHSYKTLGDKAFEFLCIIPNREDVIDIHE